MAEKPAGSLSVPLGRHDCRLTDLPKDYYRSIPVLVSHIKHIIADNERYHRRKCEKFYIGKSFVRTWKGRTFDPHKPHTTWNREGVSNRWRNHERNGFDNMTVLAVVTKDSLPPLKSRNPATWKEQYTVALEQALITHFMFVEDDPRLHNETTHPGGREGGTAVGYVLYLALKFSDTQQPAATPGYGAAEMARVKSEDSDDWCIVHPSQSGVKSKDNEWCEVHPSQGCKTLAPSKAPSVSTTITSPTTAVSPPPVPVTPPRETTGTRRHETPPPPEMVSHKAPGTCRPLFPSTPPASNTSSHPLPPPTPTPRPPPTPSVYPVTPSWGDGVKRCKCGSTEHQRTSHHTCPLRKPCKCGSTSHQRTNHSSCPLNPRYQ